MEWTTKNGACSNASSWLLDDCILQHLLQKTQQTIQLIQLQVLDHATNSTITVPLPASLTTSSPIFCKLIPKISRFVASTAIFNSNFPLERLWWKTIQPCDFRTSGRVSKSVENSRVLMEIFPGLPCCCSTQDLVANQKKTPTKTIQVGSIWLSHNCKYAEMSMYENQFMGKRYPMGLPVSYATHLPA